ncbi:hypothetical protein SAMN03097699_0753 [Flavobacteriaceae bacterium MAR_2010_188]|nr:hypothetical protein SAMN03097699_0753 [Flavobacteriaceae bacterium MAR_2010_188]
MESKPSPEYIEPNPSNYPGEKQDEETGNKPDPKKKEDAENDSDEDEDVNVPEKEPSYGSEIEPSSESDDEFLK